VSGARPAPLVIGAAPSRAWLERLALCALAAAALALYGRELRWGPALADEFIYLAGARHVAEAASLDARFYDASAILKVGHPHKDVHAPGYVLLLGLAMKLVGPTFDVAVALNALLFVAGALLVRELALGLGVGGRAAFLSGIVFLLLPGCLPYVFWAMAEIPLVVLGAAALAVAARWPDRSGALGAGLLLGLALLLRESAIFLLPPLLVLLRPPGRLIAGAAFLAFAALVYYPLTRDRAPGGANVLSGAQGGVVAHQVVQSVARGRLGNALSWAALRASDNAKELAGPATSDTERAILATFVVLPALGLLGFGTLEARSRRFLVALCASWLAIVALLFCVLVVGRFSGFRYLLVMMPGFVPVAVAALWRRRAWLALPALLAGLLAVCLGTRAIFQDYKASRQRRQERLTEYVDRSISRGSQPARRVVLTSGWLFGWQRYPTEVISSLPPGGGGQLRALEQAVSFEYLVLPGESPLREELDGRARYRRLNAGETDPPLLVYERLK